MVQHTVPYTPKQHGVPKRMKRTLKEHARALLIQTQGDPASWAKALFCTTFVHNRFWASTIPEHEIPFQVMVPLPQRHVLQAEAVWGVMDS